MTEKLILKAEDVAELLECSAKTIRDDAEKRWPGFPKAIRVGRMKRWYRQDIMDWFLSQRRAA